MGNAWENEPDNKDWIYKGLHCAMRKTLGHWCGYVAITDGHPLYRVEACEKSQQLVAMRNTMLEKPMPQNASFSLMLSALCGEIEATPANVLDVHGGITYSESGEFLFQDKSLWVFGFDCGHAGDYSPELGFPRIGNAIYRDMDYVTIETEKLAQQLINLTMKTAPLSEQDIPPLGAGKCDVF